MVITFMYQQINRTTKELEQQHNFTNDAALRAFLKLQARHYLNENEEQQEPFDAFLKCTYDDQHRAATNELAPGESVITPFSFSTDTHIHILNVVLENTTERG